jgi:predicted GH43/DUF377 family glycosyl hydrolase
MQPTPHLRLHERVIRVFVGSRDDQGIGRIGYVDVSMDDPGRVVRVSERPVLDAGDPGMFDEDGVMPCALVERDGRLLLFYTGYQRGIRVKFTAYSGLAASDDGGESFSRVSRAPITDRTDDALYFRAIHTMLLDEGRWRAWYGAGSEFATHDGRQSPRYNIRCAESPDGIHLDSRFDVCLEPRPDEQRLGRPVVFKANGVYHMFYSREVFGQGYRLGYAESPDGTHWMRIDSSASLDGPVAGWESGMQAFASVVTYEGRTLMFYSGNDFGKEGFGYAVLDAAFTLT